MRRFNVILLFAALVLSVVSCNQAYIQGRVTGLGKGKQLVIKELKGDKRIVIDSVATKSEGEFDLRLKLPKGSRDFFFLYYGDKKISSLILSPGETVKLECDTLGHWAVEGSQECEDLRQNELALAAVSRIDPLTMKDYVDYHRKMLAFVMSHSHSLTVVPVLLQKIRDIPVFGQASDGVIFRSAADSLAAVYPDSPYVALLNNAADERINAMNLSHKIRTAEAVSYPQIELPDLNGELQSLSDSESSRTLIVFWDASDVKNKIFNQDVLMPVYEKYAGSGLKIYQVGLLSDKATWAMAVRQQNLPWINVYDVRGTSIETYRVSAVPSVFLLKDGILKKIENPSREAVLGALK